MKKVLALLSKILIGLTLALPVSASDFKSDRIIITVQGEGPDVVLIPGLSSSADIWNTTISAVPGYRYHVVQVKGFAGIPAEANLTGPVIAPVAEEIARYIHTEQLNAPVIVGHSMGGTLGIMVAARHPGLISRLMVIDMMPFMGAMFMPNATSESVAPVASQVRDGIINAPLASRRVTAEQTLAGMIRTESFRAASVQHALESDPATSGQAMYDLITTDLRPELSSIRIPLHVLWVLPAGASVTAEQMGQYYQMSYANASALTMRQVPDSFHFIMFDQPELFQDELKTFLK